MLISKVSEEAGKVGRAGGEAVSGINDLVNENDPTPQYCTASELFELMAKNTRFDSLDTADSLTTRDLVLLYKNIDLGTRLMNDANGIKINEIVEKKPNQHVETVVYNDDQDSDSDFSEMLSAEDLNNVFMINEERLNFLNDKSLENVLCQKIGGVEIKSSALSTEYDKKFLFKDPYIKTQLKNLNVLGSCSQIGSVFSSSLIDYICCKRLEDNYNFYMDNIIRYVQNTIDQLKRISNGDYLTEKAKEKWREVNSEDQESNTKVLATSTSIPLHVECKNEGFATWDDIVHSEVDIRSLSKILEKKIVVEIPKLICGSYRLYSKRCADNLIISCQREKEIEKGKESRVDVVLKLQRSQTGQVISNISSIMVLQKTPALSDIHAKNILPLPYKNEELQHECMDKEEDSKEPIVTEVEPEEDTDPYFDTDSAMGTPHLDQIAHNDNDQQHDISLETNDYPFSEYEKDDKHVSFDISNQYSSESCVALKDILQRPKFLIPNEGTYNLISPDELRITMQKLNVPSSLLEEGSEDASHRISKKKSPMRVRVKSPYENKSFLLEEKKRKRLLEIRERREKKKMALGEHCKIAKHRYAKGAITPQASSSVTKLSITNKSFYNSIYGQSGSSIDNKSLKGKYHKEHKFNTLPEPSPSELTELFESSVILTPEKSKKYIDRSYYLDEAETEVMFTQLQQNEIEDKNPCSPTNSAVSNEFNADYNFLTKLTVPTDINVDDKHRCIAEKQHNRAVETCDDIDKPVVTPSSNDILYSVPENSPINKETNPIHETTKVTSVECRKSIDKLYELMKKFSKPNCRNSKLPINKTATNVETVNVEPGSTIQISENILKQHIASSNSRNLNAIGKNNNKPVNINNNVAKSNLASSPTRKKDKKNDSSAVVPKVIISSKLQIVDVEKNKKDRRKITFSPKVQADNPLKAISQLLHEFDNVQKNRHNKNEQKQWKRNEPAPIDGKTYSRQNSFRGRSRFDQHVKDNDQEKKNNRNVSPKERRARPVPPSELARMPLQQVVIDDKFPKKRISDVIDEVKEARGEAVRGPSKTYSRLNSLAQPKRSYVQAHSEEHKYGRQAAAGRPPRPAAPPAERALSASARNKPRKPGDHVASTPHIKQFPSPQLDKCTRTPVPSPTRQHSTVHNIHNNTSAGYKSTVVDAKCSEAIEKMVAVESYVKSHYGRPSLPSEALVAGHKSRVPLIPNDLELSSLTSSPAAEEANEIGIRLHSMIDSMISNAAPLTKLTECDHESKDSASTDFFADVLSHQPRRDSDYSIDVLEDKNIKTAVENIDDKNKHSNVSINRSLSKLNLNRVSSRIEMEKLENALYNQLSGAFQKRLRIKNLTLTPKHSMQQVFLVQSGDASSLLVKSTVSSIKINKGSRESLHDVEVLPVISNSQRDWNITQIPMQIATVGYVFPEYQNSRVASSLRVQELKVSTSAEEPSSSITGKSDKVNQCFKGVNLADTTAQVDTADEIMSLAGVVDNNIVHVEFESSDNYEKTSNGQYNTDDNNNNNSEEANATTTEHTTDKSSNEKDNEAVTSIQNDDIVDNAVCAEVNGADNTKEAVEKPVEENDADSVTENNNKNLVENQNSTELTNSMCSGPKRSEEVDYTTSLDMLVGLLNEIQKITCQNQMAVNNQQDCVNPNIILDDAANAEDSSKNIRSEVSMSSLDELRLLESDTSIYSLYNVSTDENGSVLSTSKPVTDIISTSDSIDEVEEQPIDGNEEIEENIVAFKAGVDKEVSANLPENKCFNNISTNVSSSWIPLPATSSDNVNNPIEITNKLSEQSLIKIIDYQSIFSDNLFNSEAIQKVIVELPQVALNPQTVSLPRDKSFLNQEPLPSLQDIKKERLIVTKDLKRCYPSKLDLDPMFKIKREILVTMYSILVFTIFAALSFPHLIFLEH